MALLAYGHRILVAARRGAASALTRREPGDGTPRSGTLAVRLGAGGAGRGRRGSSAAVISVTVRACRAGGGWEHDP